MAILKEHHTSGYERFIRLKGWLFGMPENVRIVLFSILLGLVASLGVIVFLWTINALQNAMERIILSGTPVRFIFGSFFSIIIAGLAVGLLLKKAPDAAGSGIPQLKTAYWKELGFIPLRPVITKIIAGAISIAGGFSLGREGPSIYLGGGIASNLSGYLGTTKRNRRQAALIGASAGLAAAFNTPLAAITFTLEEIIGELNTKFAGAVVLASVIGALTVHAFIGKQPAFILPTIGELTWLHFIGVPFVAALASLLGVLFQTGIISIRCKVKKRTRLPIWLLPVAGALLTWIIGSSIYLLTGHAGIFGLGYTDLSLALNNEFPWKFALLIAFAKLLATVIGYSFGGCGGVFAPLLFIGGLSGYFIASVMTLLLPINTSDIVVLSVVGMSACLGAVVHAPLTSILIVFEMTHQFELVPSLMIGTIISQSIARAANRNNLYDALLLQDGHELIKIKPPCDMESWRNLQISHVFNRKPICVSSLDPVNLKSIINSYPYERFPLVVNGELIGVVSRKAIQGALEKGVIPEIDPPVSCSSDQTIQHISKHFIDSTSGLLIVYEKGDNKVAGVITLHDLLRIQSALTM